MSNIRTCKICNLRDAKYICRECGGDICEYDFDTFNWLCIECIEKYQSRLGVVYRQGDRGFKAVMLIFLAFILITFGFFLIAIGNIANIKTVTFIFPFFITTDPILGLIALAAIILIFLIIIYIFIYRLPKEMIAPA